MTCTCNQPLYGGDRVRITYLVHYPNQDITQQTILTFTKELEQSPDIVKIEKLPL